MRIRILITGGTIDDRLEPSEEPEDLETSVPEMLKQARVSEVETEVLMQKDSRAISEKDRELIMTKCLECKEEKIVIAHGTWTMPETAKFLGKQIRSKTVVLTGAAVPFVKEKSDALFNLGFAISAVQILPPGVYLAMNGRVFDWNNVRKNPKTEMFEEEK